MGTAHVVVGAMLVFGITKIVESKLPLGAIPVMILSYVQDILDYFASKGITGGLLQQVVGSLSLATSFPILGLSSGKDVPPSNTTIQEIEFNKLPPYILKRKKGEDTFNFLPRKAKFILVRYVDSRERSIAYLVTYPGREGLICLRYGMRQSKTRRVYISKHFTSSLDKLKAKCRGKISKDKKFDSRSFRQANVMWAGVVFQEELQLHPNKDLLAFINTKERLRPYGAEDIDRKLQTVLVKFGFPVNYISSSYRLYQHYLKKLPKEKRLNLPQRFGELLESLPPLKAFITLFDEARTKDKEFKLLNETNLQGLLARFGYPVRYISSYFKLYQHYFELGLDVLERFGELLETNPPLKVFISLLEEARAKDEEFALLNNGILEGLLKSFGYPVHYISSHSKLYYHYLELGLNLPERFGKLLQTEPELKAFISLLEEARARDKDFELLNEVHLEGVLRGFGYQIYYISSYFKLYHHYLELGLNLLERFGKLLQTEPELKAFISLLEEARARDKEFKLLNETNLQGLLAGFGYPVRYISSCYKLYYHYLELGLNLPERFEELLQTEPQLKAFISLLDEARAKDEEFILLNERYLQGLLAGFRYPVCYISSYYKIYTHWKDNGVDVKQLYKSSEYNESEFQRVLCKVKRIGLPPGDYSTSVRFYLRKILIALGKFPKQKPALKHPNNKNLPPKAQEIHEAL